MSASATGAATGTDALAPSSVEAAVSPPVTEPRGGGRRPRDKGVASEDAPRNSASARKEYAQFTYRMGKAPEDVAAAWKTLCGSKGAGINKRKADFRTAVLALPIGNWDSEILTQHMEISHEETDGTQGRGSIMRSWLRRKG